MMKNHRLSKHSIRCRSAFGRFTYSNLSHFPLELTVSVITQPSPNVVTTTGVTSTQDDGIPVGSLLSPSDLGQSSTITTKPSTSVVPMKRSVSFYQVEQDNEQTTT